MKKINQTRRTVLGGLSAMLATELAAPAFAAPKTAGGKQPSKPNILFILADDMGWADMGAYGQTSFKTPHLDRLAAQGIRFTQAYATSPVCSASRLGIITGRYQHRLRLGLEEPLTGFKGSATPGLPPEHPTLPSQLKKVGYKTALVGKWHLGGLPDYSPLKSGYDSFYGNYGGAVDYFTHRFDIPPLASRHDLYENETEIHQVGYYTDMLRDRAIGFIAKHDKKEPFLLSLHFTAPHWPWQGPGDAAMKVPNIVHFDGGSVKKYGEIMESLDGAVGAVLKALDRSGMADNTIVIFTSDNGGERFSNHWPLSGQKLELLEGGIRVPTLMRWPQRIKPGQVSDQVTIGTDWMPTLLAAAGGESDPAYPFDGENMLPVFLGKAPNKDRTLFWRYKAANQRAMRTGNWKYFRINDVEFLFDVVKDERERANIAKLHPGVLADMKAKWEAWNAGMLPYTKEVFSGVIGTPTQADHYAPNPGTPPYEPAKDTEKLGH